MLYALLLALPLAVVVRATCAFPEKIAGSFRERGHTKRFLGIAGLVVGLVLVNLLGRVPALGVVALLILLFLCIVVLAGLTVAGSHLGARLFGDAGRGRGVGAFVLGWLLLAGTALFPVFGLLTMLYFAVWGAGAILLALFGGNGGEAEAALEG